jgi:NAD(P)-dependent dehydrogenase (short-subunit alcohol dehydrogenase family)
VDRLQDKVVLITGAGSGIGRAAAIACAQEGAEVVVSDVDETGGAGTVGLINASGGRADFVPADVSEAPEVERLIDECIRLHGRLDCAHNNAGVTGPAYLTGHYPQEEWEKVLRINLTGVFLCMRFELERMETQGSGVIVNTSSGAGLRGLPYQCAYSATKHAIIGLSRTAAVEYAKKGIRVNVLCPGFVDTGLTRQVIAKKAHLEERYKSLVPMGRFGTDEEVAEAVVWLFSGPAFVTGHTLVIDGGASA